MKIEVSLKGAIFQPGAIERVIIEEVTAYLTTASKLLEAEVAKRIPVNTGATRGALFSQIRGVSQSRGEAIVGLPVEHAEALESGSRPHWPPRAPIELWVRQRFREQGGSIHAAVKAIRRRGGGQAATDRAVRSLAFLVARKIARGGTKAHTMFADAEQAFRPTIEGSMYQGMLNKIAKRLSEER